MTLTIDCDWESAPRVRAPELRATWARLRISVGNEIITLAKEREAPSQIRERIDVAAYPLAEWLALNWWTLEAASHRPGFEGLSLAGAGEGFPWPSLTLKSDRQQMWIRSSPRDDPRFRLNLLGSVNAVLSVDEVRRALSRFIDATVRRIEDAGISGTLLQEEWSAIQDADDDERQFAIVAASWGLDPYDISEDASKALLSAGRVVDDDKLLADLARAVPFSALEAAGQWVRQALAAEPPVSFSKTLPDFEPLLNISGTAPWREGYRRARSLRDQLGLAPEKRVAIEDFVNLAQVTTSPPVNIEALARIDANATSALVGPDIDPLAPRGRFISARAMARRITDPHARSSLVTRGSGYTDRFERAFAAEFLAPATGVLELLDGDFSEQSQARAATTFGVSDLVIMHQIDNQLAA